MDKFINFSTFMRYLLDDVKLAEQGSKIVRALLDAQSPRISNIAEKMRGKSASCYKMIQREVRDVHKSFGGMDALDGVTFSVHGNELIGLIGPNGAGKTTLTNVLDGVHKPSQGQVWFDGQRIDGLPPYEIARRGIGRNFQVKRAFRRMTVLENMLVPAMALHPTARKRDFHQRAMEVLTFLTIEHLANEYVRSLSGGQQKLLELGRVLMLDPQLIILDEPFAGVHPKLRETICQFISTVHSDGKAFIIISHEMETIFSLSKRLLVLNFGQLIADGPPQQVREDPVVIEAYSGREEEPTTPVNAEEDDDGTALSQPNASGDARGARYVRWVLQGSTHSPGHQPGGPQGQDHSSARGERCGKIHATQSDLWFPTASLGRCGAGWQEPDRHPDPPTYPNGPIVRHTATERLSVDERG